MPAYQLKKNIGYDFYSEEMPIDLTKADPKPGFVVAKASQGKCDKDRSISLLAIAKQLGIFRGAYHFFELNDVTPQVQNYLEQMASIGELVNLTRDGTGAIIKGTWLPEMEPILDLEYEPPVKPFGMSQSKYNNLYPTGDPVAYQVKFWLNVVEGVTGLKPMIYSSVHFLSFIANAQGNLPAWLNDYRHWSAGYLKSMYVDNYPTIPTVYNFPGAGASDLWQYADDGRSQGWFLNDLNTASDEYMAVLAARSAPVPAPAPTLPPAQPPAAPDVSVSISSVTVGYVVTVNGVAQPVQTLTK